MISFFKQLFQKSSEDPAEAIRKGAVIVDVRTKEEYAQGHLAGSKNIPLNDIKLKAEMIRKWNKPVITVCRSGNRSGMAKSILQIAGIEVYNGGAWHSLKANKA
ncbi:MAG TPA: rhodanese-like domain-containing protein [Flavisolibacter sp.]|nr:rhodanese-like domain-containing protein [Flavisolibacter sp.]